MAMFLVGMVLAAPSAIGFDNLSVAIGALMVYASLGLVALAVVAAVVNARRAYKADPFNRLHRK